jgi:hypothetical protein
MINPFAGIGSGSANPQDMLYKIIDQIIFDVKQKYPFIDMIRDGDKITIIIKKEFILQKALESMPAEVRLLMSNIELTSEGLKINSNVSTLIAIISSLQGNTNKGAG